MTVPVSRQLSAVLAVGAVLVLAGCGVFLDAGRYRQVRVSWRCNGHRYAVSGDLTRETLLDVADSVACE